MDLQGYAKVYAESGSVLAAAKRLGSTYHKSLKTYRICVEQGFLRPGTPGRKTRDEAAKVTLEEPREPDGSLRAPQSIAYALPPRGMVNRFICFSAQNDTHLNPEAWRSLVALRDHYAADAKAHVTQLVGARFTYMKGGLGTSGDKARFTRTVFAGKGSSLTWPEELRQHFVDESVELAPGLVWCGEMNILPTEVSPLTGLDTYTGTKSAIIPHVKFAMRPIANNKFERAKHLYTTGTVTMRNYILRKTGLKASYHHCYGALLVEVCDDGMWFCRQLNADSDGTIYDLNLRSRGGTVEVGVPVEAIVWGDIHAEKKDVFAFDLCFGQGGVLDTLRPTKQFLHDVMDFPGPNHHNKKRGAHAMYIEWVMGQLNVRENVIKAAEAALRTTRPWCDTYTVVSNHNDFIKRWCAEQAGLHDPKNADFWLLMNQLFLDRYKEGDTRSSSLKVAFDAVGVRPAAHLEHLLEDQSFIVCPDAGGGIECGMHGHLGPNGSRGNPGNLSKVGLKACTAHIHAAGIYDGLYIAGTNGDLTPHWTSGPSAWSCSDILIYPNGKRTIITKDSAGGRWRA
jgi:hypothetical protein